MTMWIVRAGRGGEYLDEFLRDGVVGFSFDNGAALTPDATEEQVATAIAQAHPTGKEGSLKTWAAQTHRFIHKVKPSDLVATYDRDARMYLIGEITSGYIHHAKEPGIGHARRVKWTKKAPRDALLVETRNTLGAIMTFFLLDAESENDVLSHAVPYDTPTKQVPVPEPEVSAVVSGGLRQQVIEQSQELIEDRINRLSWEEMQELIAGVLRAMGYKTHVSAPGPDRGYDVFASPDGLGLQDPRVFVEVKHREGKMGSKEVRSFLGGRSSNDKCLYVSTGGFTKDAKYEAERATVPVRLLDLAQLRQLVLDHYEKLDAETAALVPLTRIYWPTSD